MSRTKARKQRHAAPLDIHVLQKKTADAVDRGAFQSAREWAKELFRREPTEEHRRLFVEATLGRADELRRAGLATDAATIVRSIVDAGFDSQEQMARAARVLLLGGEWKDADSLFARVKEPSLLAQLNATRADAAVLGSVHGLVSLPSELRSNTQRVLDSLDSIARADDRAATEAVADIAADSPHFEWRLLVEGLVAFYSGRPAVQSWQSMSPDRAPAAIAAPFRASQDRAYVDVLPALQQSDIKSFVARLNATPWLAALEDVQRHVAEEEIGAAVRRAGDVIKGLPADVAAIRSRLSRVIYWAVVHWGAHQQVESFHRILGPLPDDPHGHRLRAIQAENADESCEAQEAWAAYEQDLAECHVVAESDRDLARSLVWLRIGEIAERTCPSSQSTPNSAFTRRSFHEAKDDAGDSGDDGIDTGDEFDDESGIRFPAIECYRRSVALAPQNCTAHEFLIDLLEQRGDTPQVVAEAQRMLVTFPDHGEALSALARDASTRGEWDQAVSYQKRAVRARPHDVSVAEQLKFYQLNLARQRAQQGRFDDARDMLNCLLKNEPREKRYTLLCRLAAVEFLAGQAERGDQLIQQACQAAPSRVPVVHRLLIESIRMPLDVGQTMGLENEFRKLIKTKPDAATVRELIEAASAFRRTGATYDGLPAHEHLILDFVKRAKRLKYSRDDLLAVCRSLNAFPGEKLTLDFAKRGMKLFPEDPHFPFFAGMFYHSMGPEKCPPGLVIQYLSKAEKRAQTHAEHADLAELAAQIIRSVRATIAMKQLNSFRGVFGEEMPLPSRLLSEFEKMLDAPFDGYDDGDDRGFDWPDHAPNPRRRPR
jgi:tetratricopeptide (TPR) repeat protein